MALNPDLQRRRIKAAAALAGMNLIDFGKALPKHGVGKSAVRQILRTASDNPPSNAQEMTDAAAVAMGKVSGLPPAWFFEPDLSQLFADPETASLRQDVDRLDRHLRRLETALVEADLLDAGVIDRILDSLDTTEPLTDEVLGGGAGPGHD